ncbi:MAG TPA: hypothetical protein VFT66_23455 [Roseiflexaceae bacterium]|jgi:hypothetical protein|nr:hypothetical protein [Roseiflexaceae bacterium]
MPKRHNENADDWSGEDSDTWQADDEPTFERVRKQQGKATTMKGDRRQQNKEFGRSIFKYHKERRKDGNGKP